jgi:hypothetical protein
MVSGSFSMLTLKQREKLVLVSNKTLADGQISAPLVADGVDSGVPESNCVAMSLCLEIVRRVGDGSVLDWTWPFADSPGNDA